MSYQPYEVYKGVPIHLYQDEGMPSWQYGAMIEWRGRLVSVTVEDWEQPTKDNILKAARLVVDICKSVESEGL